MKKVIFGLTILTVVILSSCKKKDYQCECEVTTVSTITANMNAYNSMNGTTITTSNSEIELKETNKNGGKANCVSEEVFTETETTSDYLDADLDFNTSEKAYTTVSISTTECELSK